MNDKEKKYYKIITKILYVLSRILRVVVAIAAISMVVVTILFFINFNELTVNDDRFTIFDEEFIYENDGSTVWITSVETNQSFYMTTENNMFAVSNANNLLLSGKLLFIYGIIILLFGYAMIYHISNLLKNLSKENTPFVKDNVICIKKLISTYVVANIISVIYLFTTSIVLDSSMEFVTVLDILTYTAIMLVVYYIFKYGYNLENKKNTQ